MLYERSCEHAIYFLLQMYGVPRLHKNKMISIVQLAKRVSHLVLHQCGGTELIQNWICATRSMNYARAMFLVVLEELEDSGKTWQEPLVYLGQRTFERWCSWAGGRFILLERDMLPTLSGKESSRVWTARQAATQYSRYVGGVSVGLHIHYLNNIWYAGSTYRRLSS